MVLILCSGCNVHYDLKIHEDLSIDENVTCLEDNSFLKKNSIDKEKYVSSMFLPFSDIINNNNNSVTNISKSDSFGEKIFKKYSDFNDFLSNSFYYNYYFNNLDISDDNKFVTITLSDLINDSSSVTRLYFDEAVISISLPFEVVDNNADKVDIINNKYTWYFDLNNDKKIYIKFDKTKKVFRYDYLIYIIGSIVLIILIFIVVRTISSKINNRNNI